MAANECLRQKSSRLPTKQNKKLNGTQERKTEQRDAQIYIYIYGLTKCIPSYIVQQKSSIRQDI